MGLQYNTQWQWSSGVFSYKIGGKNIWLERSNRLQWNTSPNGMTYNN